jgi:GAF domain-containing protein
MRQRVSALQAMAVLDTPPEEGFDALTRLAAMVCGTPIAIVSPIDGDRIWCKSAFGVAVTAIESMASFCCEAANSKSLLHVLNARRDPRFANNPLVTGELGIRHYAGSPILHDGVGIGSVCVLDIAPRTQTATALNALTEMATIASAMLRARIEAFRLFSSSH